MVAISLGHDEVVARLLEHPEIRVNQADRDGVTPLIFAAYFRQGESTERLIQHGADVNVVDDEGFAALDVARGGRVKKALREAGAKKARDIRGGG